MRKYSGVSNYGCRTRIRRWWQWEKKALSNLKKKTPSTGCCWWREILFSVTGLLKAQVVMLTILPSHCTDYKRHLVPLVPCYWLLWVTRLLKLHYMKHSSGLVLLRAMFTEFWEVWNEQLIEQFCWTKVLFLQLCVHPWELLISSF